MLGAAERGLQPFAAALTGHRARRPLPPLWSSSLDLRPCVTLRHPAKLDAGRIPSRTSSRRFLSPRRSREWPFRQMAGLSKIRDDICRAGCAKGKAHLSRLATIRTSHRQTQTGGDAFDDRLPGCSREAISAGQHASLNRVRASIDQRSHIYLTAQLRCSSNRERFCQESQL